MDGPTRIKCPNKECRTILRIEPSHEGRTVTCPVCRKTIAVSGGRLRVVGGA